MGAIALLCMVPSLHLQVIIQCIQEGEGTMQEHQSAAKRDEPPRCAAFPACLDAWTELDGPAGWDWMNGFRCGQFLHGKTLWQLITLGE